MKRKSTIKVLAISILALVLFLIRGSPAAVDQTYEQIRLLVDVFQHIRRDYVDDVEPRELIYGAAAGMVRVLDPFSQFLEPEAKKEMQTETEGQFGGIGIRIMLKDGWLTIITPLPDTPAYRAGVLPGDRIVRIENDTTQDMSLPDAVKKLRGPPNTKVAITIVREGEKEPRDFSILRENITIQTVRSKMLTEYVGYVRVTEFIEPTLRDLNQALKALKSQGMTSLVLDLRNNPGGLLNVAVDVTKDFLAEAKLVVYTQGRTQPRQEFRADPKALYMELPLVLLMNRGSASGAEIVAGALQDHRRALVIGSESFGKGSVQSVIALEDGSGLRLTTAKYYTPLGRSIHRDPKSGKGGITPDIVIDIPRDLEAKLQAQSEELYAKGQKPASPIKPEERVTDEVLERAIQVLKVRDILLGDKKS